MNDTQTKSEPAQPDEVDARDGETAEEVEAPQKLDPTSSEVQGTGVTDHVARVKKPVVFVVAGVILAILFISVVVTEQQKEAEEKTEAQAKSEYVSAGSKNQGEVGAFPDEYEDEEAASEGRKKERGEAEKASDDPFSPENLEKRARKEDARRGRGTTADKRPDPWEQAAMQDQQQAAQEYYAARRSKMIVTGSGGGGAPASGQASFEELSTEEQVRRRMEAMGYGEGGVASDRMMLNDTRARQRAFYEKDRTGQQTQSYEQLREPRSPYLLQAGDVIPLALVTAVNSDLPGPVVARVRAPVYDSVNGDYLLIPQGSKMLGKYSTSVAHGQNRVQLAWTRLILPNGKSIQMNAPGLSNGGAAGIQDRVDMHYGKIFAGAIASSLLSLGAQSAAGTVNQEAVRPEQVAAGQVGENVASVGGKLVKRELDVKPTIKIRRGFGVQAYVSRDIELEPYTDGR